MMKHAVMLQVMHLGKIRDTVLVSSEDTPVVLGRDARSHVCLEFGDVSRQHATIEYNAGLFTLKDLASANGTRLNRSEITASHLEHGDLIEIGDFEIVVVIPQSNASDRSLDDNIEALDTLEM